MAVHGACFQERNGPLDRKTLQEDAKEIDDEAVSEAQIIGRVVRMYHKYNSAHYKYKYNIVEGLFGPRKSRCGDPFIQKLRNFRSFLTTSIDRATDRVNYSQQLTGWLSWLGWAGLATLLVISVLFEDRIYEAVAGSFAEVDSEWPDRPVHCQRPDTPQDGATQVAVCTSPRNDLPPAPRKQARTQAHHHTRREAWVA